VFFEEILRGEWDFFEGVGGLIDRSIYILYLNKSSLAKLNIGRSVYILTATSSYTNQVYLIQNGIESKTVKLLSSNTNNGAGGNLNFYYDINGDIYFLFGRVSYGISFSIRPLMSCINTATIKDQSSTDTSDLTKITVS
jgi:hypothetical protein